MTLDTRSPQPDATDLEPAPPHVKRYQRQKILAELVSTSVTLFWMAILALVLGPTLGNILRDIVGSDRWPLVIAMALLVAVSLEAATLPIDFWSSYILEHRYGLSNQTLGRWILRRLK